MSWKYESITPGEVAALHQAARMAWADDTRYPLSAARSGDYGQCYVTAAWLCDRLGGYVGFKEGHYAWVSPGHKYVLDLAPHGRDVSYGDNDGYEVIDLRRDTRTSRFIRRANHVFENLRLGTLVGDAFPGEEPQRANDIGQEHFLNQYYHDEPGWEPAQGEYRFVYGNGQLEISPSHKHEELSEHAGLTPDHAGPVAVGYVTVNSNRATWEVDSNVNVKALDRVFRDYSKNVGWDWGGITNGEGEPISDEFSPKKSNILNYVYDPEEDHVWIGRPSWAALSLRRSRHGDADLLHGRIQVTGQRAVVSPVWPESLRSLADWAEDQGLTLYSGNDNVMKTIEDLELDNLGDNKNTLEPQQKQPGVSDVDERQPSGLYSCPNCQRLFPTWDLFQKHRKEEGQYDKEPIEDGGFPENDMGATFPTHYTEMQPSVMPVASVKELDRVAGVEQGWGGDSEEYFVAYHYGSPIGSAVVQSGKLVDLRVNREEARWPLLSKVVKYTEKQPKDLLDSPIPFVYDIKEDNIDVGEPGQRTSDIPGRFTPGEIVEGVYEPGGKITLRTMTNVPYTIRHLVQLWYYQHPELSVSKVQLQDETGGTTKLAAEDIGTSIKQLVAADPAVHSAATALQEAGGGVYAVGGAIRDILRGGQPKDIDLMVTGLQPNEVRGILNALPGSTQITGKDFGVFRYKEKGNEVEIALPRKERSTGPGHRDFAVQADPHMTPQEDLWRRDFTANAMAVNLADGKLIDPYGGANDVANGVLRAHNPEALSEDPLRVVRALGSNARHGLTPDTATRQQMADNAGSLADLPGERIQAELDKLFTGENPAQAIRLAHETGVLGHIFPEVERAFGYDQNNPHHELELGDHLTKVLERTAQQTDDRDLRLAGLLHDIGKPDSAWVDPEHGTNHYYEKHMPDGTVLGANHEDVGAEQARALMNRLRYPNERIDRVSGLIQHHMWPAFTTPRGARKFLHRVGDHADDLLKLRWADQGGKSEYPTDPNLSLETQEKLINQIRNEGQATNKSQLAINGRDLIEAGVPQGPQIGEILKQLTEAVVENPALNNREQLLTLAQQSAKLSSNGGQNEEEGSSPSPEADGWPVHAEAFRQAAEDEQEAGLEEPYFPEVDDAIEANQAAHELHQQPQWNGIRDVGGLEGAINRARQHWYYGPEQDDNERLLTAAGKLAYGLGMSQSFVDGNKRTAHWITKHFLDENGLPQISPPGEDEEFADHLIGHGEGTHTEDDTINLLRNRYHGAT